MTITKIALVASAFLAATAPALAQRESLEQSLAFGVWCVRMDSQPACDPAKVTVSGDEVTILLPYRAAADTLTFRGTFAGGTMTGRVMSKSTGSLGAFTGSFDLSGRVAILSVPAYAGGTRFRFERLS